MEIKVEGRGKVERKRKRKKVGGRGVNEWAEKERRKKRS